MKIAIGADHRGFDYKEYILRHVTHTSPRKENQEGNTAGNEPIHWVDVGAHTSERSDYPEYACQVAELVARGQVDRGVILCGSGIGMVVAANRYPGVYAGVAWNSAIAQFAAQHDKINILAIPADFVSQSEAVTMLYLWLNALFLGGRYQKRIDMIDQIR